MIDKYLQNIQEGYIFSDTNISVDLEDFENNTKNNLLIIGVPGSGKTSLGKFLAKKYSVDEFVSDDHWIKFKDALLNNKRSIIEGAGLANLYVKDESWKKLLIDQPIIFMGMSALKAGYRADKRDGTVPGKVKDWKDTYYFIRNNFSTFQKAVTLFRNDVLKRPGAKVKEYVVPKFETVLN